MSKRPMSTLLASLIRTVVPVVVGLILSGLAQLGIEIDPGPLTQTIDAVFIGGYYVLIRWAESRFDWVGWFLGLPSPPDYPDRVVFTAQDPPAGSAGWSSQGPDGELP